MATQASRQRELSPQHHVARHCRRRHIEDVKPTTEAFKLREGEAFLSTNWLEYFHQSERVAQLEGVRRALTNKGFQLRSTAHFAVLNVGSAISICRDYLALDVFFSTTGEIADPSHTGIYGYSSLNSRTAALLASSVNPNEVYPATQ